MALITTSFNVATGGDCECCGGTPSECPCALLVPLDVFGNLTPTTPYADYATAADALYLYYAFDCYLWSVDIWNPAIDVSVADQLTITQSQPSGATEPYAVTGLNLFGGETLTVDYSASTAGSDIFIGAFLYDCNGDAVASDSIFHPSAGPWSGTLDLGTIAADGNYKLIINVSQFVGASSATFVINSVGIFPNPIIAQWDDSGTTRQLEACPKLVLPLIWEGGGNDWYADQTEAAGVISGMTADCFIYSGGIPFAGPQLALGASISGGTISLNSQTSINVAQGQIAIFVEAGETIDAAYTVTAGSGSTNVLVITVRDTDGNPIGEDVISSPSSGTITVPEFPGGPSLVFPYSGKYYLRFNAVISGSGTTLTADVTSTGAIDLYPIQALYATDPLLDCPGRLDCT